MINFNEGQKQLNKFGGSEKKETVLYDNNIYMLKYPDPIRAKKLMDIISYKNNQFSEYIGSNIFRSCGIDAQNTVLGYYTNATGKTKIVVGCIDFTQKGENLYEADKLANAIAPDEAELSTSIENVNRIIDETELIKNKQVIKNGFWDMFVVDALIGNKDRHFGNWGILEKNNEITFAPIYDCGSSLSALLDEDEMEQLLNKSGRFKVAEYNNASIYYMNGERIRYHEIFNNPPNDLANAIKRIVPKINIDKIHDFIDATEQMPDIRKEYLKKALSLRYEQMLIPSLNKILKLEKEGNQKHKIIAEPVNDIMAAVDRVKNEPSDYDDIIAKIRAEPIEIVITDTTVKELLVKTDDEPILSESQKEISETESKNIKPIEQDITKTKHIDRFTDIDMLVKKHVENKNKDNEAANTDKNKGLGE